MKMPDGMTMADPGQYTVICVIPSPDGKPHLAKGMMRGLVVTPGSSTAALPAPDLTMTLSDYDFQLSTPLTAGRRVIRIENTAEQPHELVLFKLNAGLFFARREGRASALGTWDGEADRGAVTGTGFGSTSRPPGVTL